MSQENDLNAVLKQYASETGVYSTRKVEKDFVEVAQQVPAQQVTNGLSEAFRSDQTPPFEEILGQSFEQVNPEQRAIMLNQLLDGASPAVVQPLMETGLSPEALNGEQQPKVTPEVAGQLAPQVVQQIALEAQQEDPAVIDKMSHLYAEDPALGRTLGGAALSVALSKMAESR